MENNTIIRPMHSCDIDAVAELEKQCFRSPWSKESLEGELKNKVAHYLVMTLDDCVIGYAGMWVMFNEAHITNIGISPLHRGKGLGKRLMLAIMAYALTFSASEMTLEVRDSNTIAQNMYFSLSFECAGIRKRYYSDTNEDAMILWNHDIEKTVKEHKK
ncbi:MAG: ribosomal protein S18-alanine N-acetyltransferase [Clostridia bacterium]|nr:ribosomal protein S18-alanine N-acetyltransferase [Clostridia bacterium]